MIAMPAPPASLPVCVDEPRVADLTLTSVEQLTERAALRRVGQVMCTVLVCKCGKITRFTAGVMPSEVTKIKSIDKINADVRSSGWVEDHGHDFDWCPDCRRKAGNKAPIQKSHRIPKFGALEDAVFSFEAGMA